MKRLRHQDWENLFSALSILHSDIDPKTLEKRCIESVNRLISAEITAFDFFDGRGRHTGKHWYDPPDSISEAEFEIFAHVAHEHPLFPAVFSDKRLDVMTTDDYLTTREFHRTAIYNEFFRIFDIDRQLLIAFSNSPNSLITCNYNRAKSPFSEEERFIFNLIARHLRIAIQNAHKIEQLHKIERELDSAMKTKANGMISLDADNRIEYQSEYAGILLEKFFGYKKNQSNNLPEVLSKWVTHYDLLENNANYEIPPTYTVETESAILSITLMFNGNTNERFLVFEERCRFSSMALVSLGLTRRESEILYWISCGKTNKDIALLLGISPRTVNKHTENIYMKLGVETRTAASSVAMDKLLAFM